MSLQLRPYQVECLEHAKNRNTIVNLPTGKGKTLIAARLIDHFLALHPDKIIAFLVPTRPLVDQQARYCEEHCKVDGRPPNVVRLIGENQADWGGAEWDACTKTCHVLLGVSALFQKAFVTDKFVNIGQISLMIYDECHHAIGNSAMASIMRDAVAPHVAHESDSPRILGLTASFVNGSLKGINGKRQALESLMNSIIIAPQVEDALTEEDYTHVHWKINLAKDRQVKAIEAHVTEATKDITIKDVRKVITRCTHVFAELGSISLMFYLEKVVVQQISEKANSLEHMAEISCKRFAAKIRNEVPKVRIKLAILANDLRNEPLLGPAEDRSSKLLRLLDLLKTNFDEHDNSYRGLVFVEQVALVSTLAKEINENLPPICCGAVAGTGYQSEADRQRQLESFRCGDCQIVVATATLEEGIDVSECEFVARFSKIQTTKAHIQGAGRARHPNAKIYYFDNNPTTERKNAADLTSTARDRALALSNEQLAAGMAKMNVFSFRHPYPFDSSRIGNEGEVNVFNCKVIFNQYCSIVLSISISPKTDLYTYTLDDSRKRLDQMRYPTPAGWKIMTATDYASFWATESMEEVFQLDRVKRKTASEKEEMAFVFMVVVELREKRYLDSHNKVDESIRFATKRNCSLSTPKLPGISIRNTVFQSLR